MSIYITSDVVKAVVLKAKALSPEIKAMTSKINRLRDQDHNFEVQDQGQDRNQNS